MLERLKRKIAENKEINVVYFGGSITEGEAASYSPERRPERNWASLLHNWFRETYPDVVWNYYNAGVGGTGSELGVFRLSTDVLAYKPDLVFVEFAVNDGGFQNYSPEEIPEYKKQRMASMEEIVRRIWNSDSKTEIVFVLTTTLIDKPDYHDKGKVPEAVVLHQQLADYYMIPAINVGEALVRRIDAEGVNGIEYLADRVHPSDKGYFLYYETIRDYLTKELAEKTICVDVSAEMPESISDGRYADAQIIPAREIVNTEFRKESIQLCGKWRGYISSDRPGTKGSLDFEGSAVGVYWMIGRDCGNCFMQVDDGEIKEFSNWDIHARKFDRCSYRMIETGLPHGKHTLRFWISENKAEESEGNFIRIAAFLVM